ncbi:MAG TPA: GntR family transcriptional regulator [Candidatus Bathyarchaeia archaeon]|nr:GntR family transcriptional regulator [Candidatus Bathyarchaeia archaeon]
MEPTQGGTRSHPFERVREHLLVSLHLGRLQPGDRVPSVRRFAVMAGMNRKTVHRAYRALVDEGFLAVRPGAGTFVAASPGPHPSARREDELIHVVNRCRSEAHALGMTATSFADFVQNALNGGLKGLPIAVVECNLEQTDMIGREVRAGLHAETRPVLLETLLADPAAALSGVWGIVTTDCHRAEVERAAQTVGTPVYRVALDPEFPRRILRVAKTRDVVLCVRDPRFGVVFRRFLGQLGATQEVLDRLHVTTAKQLRGTLREVGDDPLLLVLPLAERETAGRIGPSPVLAHWRLADGTVERLRAALAFDIARRRQGHAS